MTDTEKIVWGQTYAAVIGSYAGQSLNRDGWERVRERAALEAMYAVRALVDAK